MFTKNKNATHSEYPDSLKSTLNIDCAKSSQKLLSSWDKIQTHTPLWSLPQLANENGVAYVSVKDESKRSELGSFKALGAPNALVRLIVRHHREFDANKVLQGNYANQLKDFTVISATDGNHGRALAAAAQSIGCPCVIVLHAEVSAERESAISAYGARIIRIEGNYDQSVEKAESLAQENGWHVVSDTSYDGYEIIPADVMQGYGIIANEVVEQAEKAQLPPITHVFLQGGVGGLAAGVISYLWQHFQSQRPYFIVIEPEQADCLYQSAIACKASQATGVVDSVMAGLACGQTSPLAWSFLASAVDYFTLIKDSDAENAMKVLAGGNSNDIPIVSGESGAAGLAGWLALNPEQKKTLNIDKHSHLLFINTEGATAPSIYSDIIGQDEKAVLGRQMDWLRALKLEGKPSLLIV